MFNFICQFFSIEGRNQGHFFSALIILVVFLCTIGLMAQVPQKMSYQAIVRNAGGALVTNTSIGMQISILKGSVTGTPVYVERHFPSTNSNGLVTLEIGTGILVSGSFSAIDWANDVYFLKTETDVNGGANYTIIGTSQLLSVPYALHAKAAEEITGPLNETDPVFMSWDKSTGITITESQISNLGNYLTTENDPVFLASPSSGITTGNMSNWSTAFSWGDHSGLYRSAFWVPSWSDVTGKPTTFTPSAHSHSAADITSGTLPVTFGGTGATGFTSGNVLIGGGTGILTTLSRSGIDSRISFPPDIHSHSATDIASGTLNIARIPTGTTPSTVASGDHTHGNINTDGNIGTTAGRIIKTGTGGALEATAGTTTGQMLYWNGSSWINVPPGSTGQVLTLDGGVPTWSTLFGALTGCSTDVYNPVTGKLWMDRNLGATQVATSSTDSNAYGYSYQWGRPNDGHQVRTSGTTSTLSSGYFPYLPGHGNFILVSTPPYDWCYPQFSNLWQGVSGINNPCPTGYRLPTEAEWNAERLSWSSNNSAGAFASQLKLPAAGYRYFQYGVFSGVDSIGVYWSSTVSNTYSSYLNFNSGNVIINSEARAHGLSVRCIKGN